MHTRLDLIENEYEQINLELQKTETIKNTKKMTDLMKRLHSIEKIVEVYRKYKVLKKNIQDLRELTESEDEEMAELAKSEVAEYNDELSRTEQELKILLLPKDPADEKNVIVEIRGAAGGDEANIFAGDLFRMYSRFAVEMGWKIEVLSAYEAELGGFSLIEFKVEGNRIYSYLKYESGAHRVQRVPVTESQGRIHTSTATVLVMPEADDIDFELKTEDIRVDVFCSSGPGGQSVNTTKSAVRVTHIPSGVVATCQDGKSQHENKANALKILRTRLYDMLRQEQLEKEGQERLAKIGHGDRSEKVRTYNYPQNRVTDHRISLSIQQLDRIMEGKLLPVTEALMSEDQKRILASAK